MSLTNKYSKTGVILFALGVLITLLWFIFIYEGDGISNFVAVATGIVGVGLIIAGVVKIAINSGSGPANRNY